MKLIFLDQKRTTTIIPYKFPDCRQIADRIIQAEYCSDGMRMWNEPILFVLVLKIGKTNGLK